MSEKYAAYGAKLQYLDGATWTDIAGVRDISGPGLSADTIDVTSHSSAGAVREFIKSLIDAGELSFDLVWDPEDEAGQRVLLDRMLLVSAAAVHPYRLVFATTNSKTWQFNAVVSKFEPSNPVEGEISASVTLKISGLPTFDV
jgi:predicted secreted protein